MLKIWGRINSLNVQKVVWAAGEVGRPFERIDAGMHFGINKTPEYLSKNPNGLVPTIDDDGFVLWESNAIVRYVASRYGAGSLWPTDGAAHAHADAWMDWASTGLYPAFAPAFMNLVRYQPDKRDMGAVESSRAKTEDLMAVLDAHLGRNAYVAGSTFTMGDIPAGVAVHRWLHMPVERVARPNVERWYRAIAERPASAAALILPVT